MNNENNQNTQGMGNQYMGNNSDANRGGEGMNNNSRRYNSPMESARRNGQRGFDQNPYIQRENRGEMNRGRGQNGGAGRGAGMRMGQGGANGMQSPGTGNIQNPYYNTNNQIPNNQSSSLLGSFDTANFIKGALIGAVGAYLLTNEKAQKTIFKGVVKATDMFQAGMEEIKERFEDAKAELEAEEQEK